MDLQALAEKLRKYPGVTRKRTISEVIGFFPSFLRTTSSQHMEMMPRSSVSMTTFFFWQLMESWKA